MGTQSPPEQLDRERKAAGVTLFRINCSKDLWEVTSDTNPGTKVEPMPVLNVVDKPNATVTVDLSGPQLVAYLQMLDRNAHPGRGGVEADQRAIRMYEALAPAVDSIGTPRSGQQGPPTVTVDDTTLGVPTGTPSP